MNTKPILDYIDEIDFTKHLSHDGDEIVPDILPDADDGYQEDNKQLIELSSYLKHLHEMKRGFEDSLFQAVPEPSFKEQLHIIAKRLQDIISRYNDYKNHELLSLTLGKEHELQNQMAEEALTYLKDNYGILPDKQFQFTSTKESSTIQPSKPSRFQRTLDEYGELLSVKDLTAIFRCDRKTIYNWEKKGYLTNVSETSGETNVLGNKKRGEEKRFLKEAILKRIELQEKFNSFN